MNARTLQRIAIALLIVAVLAVAGIELAAIWLDSKKLALTGIVVGTLTLLAAMGFGILSDETDRKAGHRRA